MKKICTNKLSPYIIIGLLGIFILLPQIYARSVTLGSDLSFHYSRFYDMSQQIKLGSFNYYQTLYSFDSSGRIINALYGYDFAFLNGILVLIANSWFRYQLLSSFLCLYLAGTSIYLLAKTLKIKTSYSLMASAMYMASAPIAYWVRGQGFAGWGSAMLPLLFIVAIRSINNNEKPIAPVQLAVIVSVLLNTHILTTLLGILAIIPFYIISFYQSKEKIKWLINALLAVLLTIVLSLNTLVAYIEVFLSNNILSPFIPSNFQSEAVKISYFDINNNWNTGLFFSFIFIIQIIFIIIRWNEINIIQKIIGSVGSAFLLLSSIYLPWNSIIKTIPTLQILQFPHRFIPVAYILLIVGFFLSIEELSFNYKKSEKKDKLTRALLLTLTFFILNSAYLVMNTNVLKWDSDPISTGNNRQHLMVEDKQTIRDNFKSSDLTKGIDTIKKGTPDYLPIYENRTSETVYDTVKPYELYKKEIINNREKFTKKILDNGEIEVIWDSVGDEELLVPIIVYNHSTVNLNGKNLTKNEYKTSEIGSLIVKSNKGENTLIVGYSPVINMRYILIIKITGWIVAIFYLLFKIIFKSKQNRN